MTSALSALLVCVGRHRASPDPQTFARFTESDRQELLERAEQHRLTALLYARLSSHRLVAYVPANLLPQLRWRAAEAAARIRAIAAAARTLNHSLRDRGIEALMLKGTHLAAAVYESELHREMIDIDVLVHAEDVQKAVAAIESLGYRPKTPLHFDVAFAARSSRAAICEVGQPGRDSLASHAAALAERDRRFRSMGTRRTDR